MKCSVKEKTSRDNVSAVYSDAVLALQNALQQLESAVTSIFGSMAQLKLTTGCNVDAVTATAYHSRYCILH